MRMRMKPRTYLFVGVFVVAALTTLALTTGVGVAQQNQDGGQVSGDFVVSDFQAPGQTNPRAGITASATVRNTGDTRGTAVVQYKISNRVIDEREVDLDPGESRVVTLSGVVPTLSAGTHEHGVFVEGTDAEQTSVVVLGPRSAAITVVSMQPSATEGTAGSGVSVTTTITNNGNERGIREIQYRIKGKEVASDVVSLDPGESTTITLSGSVPNRAVGTHSQGVYLGSSNSGLVSTFRITSTGASFEVKGMTAPSSATGGETVTARATVTNTGGTSGTQRVEYRIDGETVATDEVTLSPGERTRTRLQGSAPDRSRGTYEQGIFLGSSDVGVSSRIVLEPEDAARFTVYDLTAPSQVEVGSGRTVSVAATVENAGEIEGSTRVEYRVNGSTLESREINLGEGGTERVRLSATLPELGVGTYQHGVFVGDTNRGQTSSLRVTSQPLVSVTGFRAPFFKTTGSSVSVSATLRNSNDQRESRTVEYRVGDTVVASENVSVGAVSSTTITLQGTLPSVEAGTYQQGVFVEDVGLRKSITLSEPPETVSDGDGGDGNGDGGSGADGDGGGDGGGTDGGTAQPTDGGDDGEGLPGFTAVVGVVALLTAVAVSRLRKRD